jgi:hypothetical protein
MERDETSTKAADKTADHSAPIPAPVIVDLGNKSKKAIKKLKRGSGKLMYEVEDAIEQVRSRLPDTDKGKQIIPVLVIYRQKRKRAKMPSMPFSPLSLFR